MHRPIDRTARSMLVIALASVLTLAACTGPGASAAPSDEMMDHSAVPSDEMMDHSAVPSDEMMDHSEAPAP